MCDRAERIAAVLNGFADRMAEYVPETMGNVLPCAGVFLLADVRETRYVDGSVLCEVPFEVRIRIGGRNVRERLSVRENLASLGAYLRTAPLYDEGILGIAAVGGAERSAVYQNGNEEYRMCFRAKVKE